MRKLLISILCFIALQSKSQIVSNISADYHNGQIFLVWKNFPGNDTAFYYVYRNSVPIHNSNIQSSQYLGRTRFDFGYDYRLSYSLADGHHYTLVTNDTPYTALDSTQNLFVMNCTVDGEANYFAVRCDYKKTSANWKVVADSNATSTPVIGHLDPIKCYVQLTGIIFPGANNGETLDAYIHYGGNVAVGDYPALANEACLAFHFGIIKSGPAGGYNSVFLKFHGGNGNFVSNTIATVLPNSWKFSFDDWIPGYHFDSSGYNTRWLGYHEKVDVYTAWKKTAPPKTGTVRAYTFYRIQWELRWASKEFPHTLDSTREYLVGNSQGCSAVLLNSMVSPGLFAGGNLSDGKFNVAAPDDDNPDCKYNNDGSGIIESRVLWGHEDSTNLFTDLPAPGNSFYRIYDLTNAGHMLNVNRNKSLPFLYAINGKNDVTTCWEEKIPAYDSIQSTRAGGIYEWDLRSHSGSGNNEWPTLDISELQRFSLKLSYPGFSNTSLDGNPGADTVTTPPYYNGDDVGSLHANIDWLDSSIVDRSDLWQIEVYETQRLLNDGTYIPKVLSSAAIADITIKRAQQFKDFPDGAKICWMNFHQGELVQSGSTVQSYVNGVAAQLTLLKVKIFPDGNIVRAVPCDSLQPTGFISPDDFNNQAALFFKNDEAVNALSANDAEFFDLFGNKISHHSNNPALRSGIYYLRVKSESSTLILRLYKI